MNASIYMRPDKPMFLEVKDRSELILEKQPVQRLTIPVVDKSTECHVTPKDVAQRMVQYASPGADEIVLEPEGGTGNIVAEILDYGVSPHGVHIVEREFSLFAYLVKRFETKPVKLTKGCFLDFVRKTDLRAGCIIMNPPFKPVMKHIEAAMRVLSPFGCIVALVPESFEYPNMIELEKLPDTTFSTTKVRTKIVYLTK